MLLSQLAPVIEKAEKYLDSAWDRSFTAFVAVVLLVTLLSLVWWLAVRVIPKMSEKHTLEVKEIRQECAAERKAFLESLERIETQICTRLDRIDGEARHTREQVDRIENHLGLREKHS